MKVLLKKFKAVLVIVMCTAFVSCNGIGEENENYIPITLSKGAVVFNNSSGRIIYNLVDGIYKSIDERRNIIEYNKQDTILFERDNKGVIQYKGKEIILDEDRIIKENISALGNYIMYFVDNGALELKIFNLETEKYENLEINGFISGDLVDWYNETSIVFYGVDEKKNNGIFTYDIENKTQKQIYNIEEGYISYLENIKGKILIKEENFNSDVVVKIIKDDGKVEIISKNIEEIIDVEETSKGLFLLGKRLDDNISLYEYKGGDFQRVVYNFPSYINIESRLSSTEEGDVLFVGSNSNPKEHSIYKYSEGTISTMSANKGQYNFIKIR